ncbi:MAG: PAS domain-containing sensor histidine kinase [Pseudomonadota bacterium]
MTRSARPENLHPAPAGNANPNVLAESLLPDSPHAGNAGNLHAGSLQTESAGADARAPACGADALGLTFRAIAEIDGDVAFIVDCGTGLPSYMSPAIEALLGYSADEFAQHMGGRAAQAALAGLCAGLPQRLQRFAGGDLTRLRVVREFDLFHKDGREVALEAVSMLLQNNGAAPHALVGLLRDIGPRREREAAHGRFARMLNHEFRTPLSTIDGAIQRLEVTGAGADEPTLRRYRKIGAAVERMIGMLDEHLSPERVAGAGARRAPGTAAPRALLEQGAAALRAAGHAVTLEHGTLPPAVRCEPDGLRLALQMLLDNATRYAAGCPVALAGRACEGGVELLVRDGGAGVAPDETDSIFDKGYRGRNSMGKPGSGLGLYLARSVLDVHGGSVTMRNVETGGAEFRIWLPIRINVGKYLASDRHQA